MLKAQARSPTSRQVESSQTAVGRSAGPQDTRVLFLASGSQRCSNIRLDCRRGLDVIGEAVSDLHWGV